MSRPMRLGRRAFLRSAGLTLAAAACAPRTGTAGRGLDTTFSLRMLNWTEYVDLPDGDEPGTVVRFEQATGIVTAYEEAYEGNEELLAILDGWPEGQPDASIVVPTNWLAERLRDDGRLERLPLEVIPNHANLDPSLLGLPWDRGARWHLPWQVGYTGLAYPEPDRLVGSLQDLLTARRPLIIPEWREAVGLMMLVNGDDPGRADLAAASRALDRIEELVDRGARVSYDFVELLAAGEVDVAMAWSGDLAFARLEGAPLSYVIPAEGAVRWFDTMVIPRGAPDYANAGAFMDFVYDPVNAARITAFVLYASPVLGVQEQLRREGLDDLADNALLFPDATTAQRLVTFAGLSRADEDRVEARFAEVAPLEG